MIPLRVCLDNFQPFATSTLPLEGVHLACITGHNGAGKSSLLDALTWALWGRSRNKADEDVIRGGANETSVSLQFSVNGAIYAVTRKKKRGKGKSSGQALLELRRGEDVLTGATIKETQAAINALINMDYATCINSVYLRQNHYDEFTVALPSERQAVIGNVLGLGLYVLLEEHAKDRAKAIAGAIVGVMHALADMDRDIGRRQEYADALDAAQAKTADVERAIAEADQILADLRQLQGGYQEKQAALTGLTRSRAKAGEQRDACHRQAIKQADTLQRLQAMLQNAENIRAAVTKLAQLRERDAHLEEYRTAQAALLKTESEHSHAITLAKYKLEAEIKQHKETLSHEYRTGYCDKCGAVLNPENRVKHEAEREHAQAELDRLTEALKNEDYAVGAQMALEGVREEIATMDYDQDIHRKIKAEIQGLIHAERDMAQLEVAEQQLPDAKATLQEAMQKEEEWIAEIDRLDTESAQIKKDLAQYGGLAENIALTERTLADNRAEQKTILNDIARNTERLRHCDELSQQSAAKRQTLEDLRHRDTLYRELAEAFSKRGVPAEIVKAAIPEIEDEANRLLSLMTDGRMQLALVTQQEARTTGNVSETLDIVISDEMGIRPYEMYSGGESFRINFALRLALSRLVANRAGAPMSMLLIDEGFGSQDANGVEKVVSAIQSIKDEFKLVLVITHLEELKERFGQEIRVTKLPGGSTITLN